jgi:DNA-binding transcriptional LysR family regulator
LQLISQAAILLDVVARSGSFRRAAERLNLSASAINRQILKLEEDVGLPLFERLPRGIRPTAAGERLLTDIRRWRREQERAEGQLRDLKGQRRGSITLGAMECFGNTLLPDVIKKMHSVNPLIEVSVLIGGTDELLYKLNQKELDFALLFNPPHRIAAEAIRVLKARPVWSWRPTIRCAVEQPQACRLPAVRLRAAGSIARDPGIHRQGLR